MGQHQAARRDVAGDEDVERALRALAMGRSIAVVGSSDQWRARMLGSLAQRLAADGLPAVLFSSDSRRPSASTSVPMSALARTGSRLDLRRIAASRDLQVGLRARCASLIVLIDRPVLLPAVDRRAAAGLLVRSDVSLVTGWSPSEWAAVLHGRLDQAPHDRFTDLVDAELITGPELTREENRLLLTLYRRIGLQRCAADAGPPAVASEAPTRERGSPGGAPGSASRPSRSRLTRREREIAEMIGDGLTDRQIAERLHLSTRTVESHVLHARGRIGAGTRAALAAAVLRDRLEQEEAHDA